MGGLCNAVTGFASLFILLALVLVTIEAFLALVVKWQARKIEPKSQDRSTFAAENLGPILEGLAKVLAALKELPPWIAIFLAGLALVWTATSAPGLCAT